MKATLEKWKPKAGYLRKADKALVGLALPPVWAMALECYDALKDAVAEVERLREALRATKSAGLEVCDDRDATALDVFRGMGIVIDAALSGPKAAE